MNETRDLIIGIDFGKEYENVANAENVDDILKTLKAKLKK